MSPGGAERARSDAAFDLLDAQWSDVMQSTLHRGVCIAREVREISALIAPGLGQDRMRAVSPDKACRLLDRRKRLVYEPICERGRLALLLRDDDVPVHPRDQPQQRRIVSRISEI
jgi:hypothetical protein